MPRRPRQGSLAADARAARPRRRKRFSGPHLSPPSRRDRTAVEGYHAGNVRTNLHLRGLFKPAQAISDLRDKADGPGDDDQGAGKPFMANIVPTGQNGIAFSRTPGQVLSIVYLGGSKKGGFFPNGLDGTIA